jgi:hypothetical protein
MAALKQQQHDQQRQKPTQQQVLIASVCITVIITLYSLVELQSLLHSHSSSHGMPEAKLPGGAAAATTFVAATAGRLCRAVGVLLGLAGIACHGFSSRPSPVVLHGLCRGFAVAPGAGAHHE